MLFLHSFQQNVCLCINSTASLRDGSSGLGFFFFFFLFYVRLTLRCTNLARVLPWRSKVSDFGPHVLLVWATFEHFKTRHKTRSWYFSPAAKLDSGGEDAVVGSQNTAQCTSIVFPGPPTLPSLTILMLLCCMWATWVTAMTSSSSHTVKNRLWTLEWVPVHNPSASPVSCCQSWVATRLLSASRCSYFPPFFCPSQVFPHWPALWKNPKPVSINNGLWQVRPLP